MRVILVVVHFLAECPGCGTIASVLLPAKPNLLERRVPKCLRCGLDVDPITGTVDVTIQLEESP